MDTVNTESVEGVLVYIQAECINVNARSFENRCDHKNNAKNLVFYDIAVVHPNASIAQLQDTWETCEYYPMISMKEGDVRLCKKTNWRRDPFDGMETVSNQL